MTKISLPLSQKRLDAVASIYAQTRRAKQRRTLLGGTIFVLLSLVSAWKAEVSLPVLFNGIPRLLDYLWNLVPALSASTFAADMGEWYWGLKRWTRLLIDTILIAYVGTLAGTLFGGYLSYLASANLNKSKWMVFVTRRFLEFCRTVPEIVFALIFVVAFGLGPVPGVLAIMIHTIGAMGKLFAEVNENASLSPVEGIASAGAGWHATMIFGVLPQVLPNYISYALLRFEVNIRGAAVMGFVGAGGIGQELVTAIRQFYYSDISAILLMLIATVMVVDILTEKLRHHIIKREGAR